MNDPTFNSVTIRQPTADTKADLLTLDSVSGSDGNGAALRFINNSEGALSLTLGRIEAWRMDPSTVRLDLALTADPTMSGSDATIPLLSLLKGVGAPRISTAFGSTLDVDGALRVSGATTIAGSLRVSPAGVDEVFNITRDGRVGIGTTSPRDSLHVAGRVVITPPEETSQHALIFAASDSKREVYLSRYTEGYPYEDLAIGYKAFPRAVLGTSNEHLFIGTRTAHTVALSTTDLPRLVVGSDGNIGIGTTNPQARLHIQPPVRNNGIRLDEVGDNGNLTGRFLQIYYEGNGRVMFCHQDNRGQFMTPDGKWNLGSDVSLKEDITRLEGSFAKAMQLKPVSFTWRNSCSRDIGFIAQDVEAVFPELVSSVNNNGTPIKGLPYASFAVLAIAALQEMAQTYEARITALENQVKTFRQSA